VETKIITKKGGKELSHPYYLVGKHRVKESEAFCRICKKGNPEIAIREEEEINLYHFKCFTEQNEGEEK
jgi:hypothetical protein